MPTPDPHLTGPFEPAEQPAERFAPGVVLAGRYRIVAALGRGGMGEVYRADDLTLGQPVALKFLPPHLAADPGRLQRFRTEVAVARRVSHPNVCRVYDIADVDGQPAVAPSMGCFVSASTARTGSGRSPGRDRQPGARTNSTIGPRRLMAPHFTGDGLVRHPGDGV
jgi:Protein kinase domain